MTEIINPTQEEYEFEVELAALKNMKFLKWCTEAKFGYIEQNYETQRHCSIEHIEVIMTEKSAMRESNSYTYIKDLCLSVGLNDSVVIDNQWESMDEDLKEILSDYDSGCATPPHNDIDFILLNQNGEEIRFNVNQKIIIDSAHANDNFTLVPSITQSKYENLYKVIVGFKTAIKL